MGDEKQAAPPGHQVVHVDANTVMVLQQCDVATATLKAQSLVLRQVGQNEASVFFLFLAAQFDEFKSRTVQAAASRIQVAQPGDVPPAPRV